MFHVSITSSTSASMRSRPISASASQRKTCNGSMTPSTPEKCTTTTPLSIIKSSTKLSKTALAKTKPSFSPVPPQQEHSASHSNGAVTANLPPKPWRNPSAVDSVSDWAASHFGLSISAVSKAILPLGSTNAGLLSDCCAHTLVSTAQILSVSPGPWIMTTRASKAALKSWPSGPHLKRA